MKLTLITLCQTKQLHSQLWKVSRTSDNCESQITS
jgi:hypothetical protein